MIAAHGKNQHRHACRRCPAPRSKMPLAGHTCRTHMRVRAHTHFILCWCLASHRRRPTTCYHTAGLVRKPVGVRMVCRRCCCLSSCGPNAHNIPSPPRIGTGREQDAATQQLCRAYYAHEEACSMSQSTCHITQTNTQHKVKDRAGLSLLERPLQQGQN